MNSNFKVLRLRLIGNPIFSDIDVNFYDIHDNPDEPYTTLIIGANGTGKSNLQRIIILLFSELNTFKKTGKRVAKIQGNFILEYSQKGMSFQYTNYDFIKQESKKPEITRNGIHFNYKEVLLPNNVIALSVMLTDKYPVTISDYEDYVYLGVRVNSNTARTSTFINKTTELLFETLEDEKVTNNIMDALDFLGYETKLYVSYYPRYKHIFFKGDLQIVTFEKFFTHYWLFTRREKGNDPWSLATYNRLKSSNQDDVIHKLVKLCNKISSHLEKEFKGSRTEYFEFDVFDNIYSQEELKLLKILHALDIISSPGIGFQKLEKYFQLHESSSGEYHFISGFIGLLAKIKPYSLILIDEPENSLHPNWQMKYISFLKKVFKDYKTCHLILTSHSHFMVSDLAKESSTTIALSKEDKITATTIPSNTYGWSAEEILLKIFKAPSSRNYYLTEKLEKIFSLISEEPSKENDLDIIEHIRELKQLDLSGINKEDPLKHVINTLFKKLEHA